MTFLDGHDAIGKEIETENKELEGIEEVGALKVLKRGLRASPELRAGISLTALMALAVAGGKLLVPLTIKEVLDRGITTNGCLLYTSPSPRDKRQSRMPSSA